MTACIKETVVIKQTNNCTFSTKCQSRFVERNQRQTCPSKKDSEQQVTEQEPVIVRAKYNIKCQRRHCTSICGRIHSSNKSN